MFVGARFIPPKKDLFELCIISFVAVNDRSRTLQILLVVGGPSSQQTINSLASWVGWGLDPFTRDLTEARQGEVCIYYSNR